MGPSSSNPAVLIVGAGPTGLVLALWLTRMGIAVRIIDQAAEPGTTSRALVVHARTLEFYRQLGFAADVVRAGEQFAGAQLWVGGRRVARAEVGDIGAGSSPYPFMLVYPQDEHERLLIDCLRTAGVTVERPVRLVDFTDDGAHVTAHLDNGSSCRAPYIAGCDGARSSVRQVLGAGFHGGTYPQVFYVADVVASGPVMNGDLNVALDEADFVAVFPMKGGDRGRIIGAVRGDASETTFEWKDVSKEAVNRLQIDVERVNWFSTYHVHHRVADHFRRGRAFLLGDAAHVHSPVGGQGMNTGIGDAVNLAWKLAAVIRGRSPEAILDTYEPERIAFARRLVATTDRAFNIATRRGKIARYVRMELAPSLVPFLTRLTAVRRLWFATVSQINIRYRSSALSRGQAGDVHGGDRLPWLDTDNFTPLASLDWQAHVYGEPAPEVVPLGAERGIPLHTFAWRAEMRRAGLARDALYVVRPDGYVGLADPRPTAEALASYLDAVVIPSGARNLSSSREG